jgi:hypothetical protein
MVSHPRRRYSSKISVDRQFYIHGATQRNPIKLSLAGGLKTRRKTIFTEQQERELCRRLLQIQNMIYGVNLVELQQNRKELEKN